MDSILFLVRVWRLLAAAEPNDFRASVRAVGDEGAELFTSAADVARYLERTSRVPLDEAQLHCVQSTALDEVSRGSDGGQP